MELYLSEERRIVSAKNQSLLREAEAAEATIKSTLEAQKAAEKKTANLGTSLILRKIEEARWQIAVDSTS